MFGYLTYGYGVNGELWPTDGVFPVYQDEGTVKFGTLEDGFREYLVMMNQWYNDGLISSDFVSNTDRNMFDPDTATASTVFSMPISTTLRTSMATPQKRALKLHR